jgi:hypothetical protein
MLQERRDIERKTRTRIDGFRPELVTAIRAISNDYGKTESEKASRFL